MEEPKPWKVYSNLIILVSTYRGYTITSKSHSESAELVRQLNDMEYTIITGTRTDADIRGAGHIAVVLIAPDSKYATKAPDFNYLVKKILGTGAVYTTLMFVSAGPLTTHVAKALAKQSKLNPGIYIEGHEYDLFVAETPKHITVPPHRIASREEVDMEVCLRNYTSSASFPRMNSTDPQAIWRELRPGMVMRIDRNSDVAGVNIVYKICLR